VSRRIRPVTPLPFLLVTQVRFISRSGDNGVLADVIGPDDRGAVPISFCGSPAVLSGQLFIRMHNKQNDMNERNLTRGHRAVCERSTRSEHRLAACVPNWLSASCLRDQILTAKMAVCRTGKMPMFLRARRRGGIGRRAGLKIQE
jgi:hypothetical protein